MCGTIGYMTNSDTIGRVARPRGVLSKETFLDLAHRKSELEELTARYRWAVVQALSEGSFSAVAEVTGLSKDTLQRWKREASENEPCPYCQAPWPEPCYPGCASDSE